MAKRKRTDFRNAIHGNYRKEAEARSSYGYLNLPKGVSMFSIPDSVTRMSVDFIPYIVTDKNHPDYDKEIGCAEVGTEWWKRPFKIHRDVGINNETVVCPKSIGQKCPICEHRIHMIRNGAPKDEFKLLYPKERSLYVIIPLNVEGHDEAPHVWDMSDFLLAETIKDVLREEPDNASFPSIYDDLGRTAKCRIKWKSIGDNSYPEVSDIQFIEREPYDESILDETPNLDNLLRVHDYDTIKAMFFDLDNEEDGGTLTDIDDDDDDDLPVATTRRKRPLRAPARPEPDDDDDDDDGDHDNRDDDDGDDDAPAPKRPSRPTRTVKRETKPTRTTKRKPVDAEVENECPHGHQFGIDADKFDDCDTCRVWNECLDAAENN